LKKNNNILPVNQAIGFFQDIVNGFSTLYEHKIIHRDIKPANIMIKKGNLFYYYLNKGVCMISDFGFARCLEEVQDIDQKASLTLLGTPLYMSPQILKEE
jgi:serine/threonine protein kinase